MSQRGSSGRRDGRLYVLWAAVLLELISPVPAVLTFGAIYVLAFRPPWFAGWIRDLYDTPPGPD